MKRSICLFPKFTNEDRIHKWREKYDPLHQLIPPHITLVFPFESDYSSNKLIKHVQQTLKGFKPINIRLQGITGEGKQYVFLNVKRGSDQIIELHDRLYSGLLKKYLNRTVTYNPHLTIGRIKNTEKFDTILEETSREETVFCSNITEIICEKISNDEKSIIEFKHLL
ncbi:2'-5' RNA ligase [Bacillus pakistanensis]|uniref:2'-5' RNA ligase n=1 Tax=Rossellomorea pakistanensis TaxID=992288 RepID=A0ABS2N7I7_9BACI|nr:2'-5' RNA ligase family protein [Bacillus pakistanensis]MBM7583816.1 2'-5' RNA ligase [Bacillus pakistanensis]